MEKGSTSRNSAPPLLLPPCAGSLPRLRAPHRHPSDQRRRGQGGAAGGRDQVGRKRKRRRKKWRTAGTGLPAHACNCTQEGSRDVGPHQQCPAIFQAVVSETCLSFFPHPSVHSVTGRRPPTWWAAPATPPPSCPPAVPARRRAKRRPTSWLPGAPAVFCSSAAVAGCSFWVGRRLRTPRWLPGGPDCPARSVARFSRWRGSVSSCVTLVSSLVFDSEKVPGRAGGRRRSCGLRRRRAATLSRRR